MAFDGPGRKRDDALHPLEKKTLFLSRARSRATFKDRDFPSSIVLLFVATFIYSKPGASTRRHAGQ